MKHDTLRQLGIAAGLAGVLASGASQAQLTFPTVPLFISGSAEPNVMLVVDSSGSMRNIVADLPFVESPTYPAVTATASYYQVAGATKVTATASTTAAMDTLAASVCPTNRRARTDRVIMVAAPVANGAAPRFYYEAADTSGAEATLEDTLQTFGTGTNQLCFDPRASYDAKLFPTVNRNNFSTGGTFAVPEGRLSLVYFESGYSGNYLNWYFNATSVTGANWNAAQQLKPVSPTTFVRPRIDIAKDAASNLVDTVDSRIRMGLTIYDNSDGGRLAPSANTFISPLDAAKRTSLKTAINAIPVGGNTPLAETLADIGQYFSTGSPTLRLHPDRANNTCAAGNSSSSMGSSTCLVPSTANNNAVFNRRLGGAGSDYTAPVTLSCQKNFVAFLTDGRNTLDQGVSNYMKDYDGDCTASSANYAAPGPNASAPIRGCAGIDSPDFERKYDRLYDENYKYNDKDTGRGTSDYLDDVAKALYEMDLRPSGTFADQTGTPSAAELAFPNNVRTDIIAFADPTVLDDKLLKNTALQGGGTFRPAADAASLAAAFKGILDDVLATSGSASNASTSAGRLGDGASLYQAGFNSGDWSGFLKSFRISTGTGGSCPAVPAGRLCTGAEWDAADRLNAVSESARRIYTMQSQTRVGTTFNWTSISGSQRTLLQRNPATPAVDEGVTVGQNRLLYLRGDRSNEGTAAGKFRVRTGKLGDIVNSDPVLVAAPRFNYNFPGYAAFRNSQKDRAPVIYVGGNDGMLHGFRTTSGGGAQAGDEVLGYVPTMAYGTDLVPTLSKLTQTPYTHQFVVDGSPAAGDAQIGAANDVWATVLVGTMRSGGKGVFALNVTNPGNFTDANAAYDRSTNPNGVVMWEFTNADDAALGNTYSQPSIVKMRNGKWAAIFGNGYNGTLSAGADANKAALFIVYLTGPTGGTSPKTWQPGIDYVKLTVNSALTTPVTNVLGAVPNGLASPTPVDVDGDRIVDFIYAGDLAGNMWRFDVDDASSTNWKVAYTGAPIYVARDADSSGNRQPITSRPEVGFNVLTDDEKDLVVYFGTGKYLEGTDNTQSGQPNQTFYAIFDDPYADNGSKNTMPQASNRASLLRQTIVSEPVVGSQTFRVTSDNALNLATHKGWFIDLVLGSNRGERSVSAPVLSSGSILFSTQIPSATACSGGGSGFLMSLDARSGKRLVPQFDSNNNGSLDSGDLATGVQSAVGLIDKPVVFNLSGTEDMVYLLGTGCPGGECPNSPPTQPGGCGAGVAGLCQQLPNNDRRGRVTWREIIK